MNKEEVKKFFDKTKEEANKVFNTFEKELTADQFKKFKSEIQLKEETFSRIWGIFNLCLLHGLDIDYHKTMKEVYGDYEAFKKLDGISKFHFIETVRLTHQAIVDTQTKTIVLAI